MSKGIRVDKWLWATRFFKTRSLASRMCEKGKIKRNGHALKAAAALNIGELLEIPSHDGLMQMQIEVVELIEKRVKSPLAKEAYRDHTPEALRLETEEKRKQLRQNRLYRQSGDQGRMTKKQRRNWKKQNSYFGDV